MSPLHWLARWRCHRSLWCCQHVDHPMCNSPRDPHRLARWRFKRQERNTIETIDRDGHCSPDGLIDEWGTR